MYCGPRPLIGYRRGGVEVMGRICLWGARGRMHEGGIAMGRGSRRRAVVRRMLAVPMNGRMVRANMFAGGVVGYFVGCVLGADEGYSTDRLPGRGKARGRGGGGGGGGRYHPLQCCAGVEDVDADIDVARSMTEHPTNRLVCIAYRLRFPRLCITASLF